MRTAYQPFFRRLLPFLFSVSSFSCYARPRDLHSFPTRRSSDLGDVAPGGDGLVAAARRARSAAVRKIRDRKSTRLNSSHLVISYAVFCLKKKRCFTPTL